jgi:hypothetical protein
MEHISEEFSEKLLTMVSEKFSESLTEFRIWVASVQRLPFDCFLSFINNY